MSKNPGFVRVQSLKNQAVISDKCIVAEQFFVRLRGLIGKKAMTAGEGMLFPRNNSIHMWFMSIPIDVVFVRRSSNARADNVWEVTSVHPHVMPWKALPLLDWRARDTIELPEGTIDRCAIAKGDELCIS